MLTQKARYALRALFVLAQHKKPEPLSIGDIAEQGPVPKKFLEQILLDLKRRSIVQSVRGKYGGYRLGRAADQIFLAEIIRTIDGPLALSPCASKTAYRRCDDCVDEKTCSMRKVLIEVRDATSEILENRSLASMMKLQPASGRKRGNL